MAPRRRVARKTTTTSTSTSSSSKRRKASQKYRTTGKRRKVEKQQQQQLHAIANFNKVLQQARKKWTKGMRRKRATTTNQMGEGIFSVLIPLLATVIGSAIGG